MAAVAATSTSTGSSSNMANGEDIKEVATPPFDWKQEHSRAIQGRRIWGRVTELEAGWLWIGSRFDALDYKWMIDNGITHILNAAADAPCFFDATNRQYLLTVTSTTTTTTIVKPATTSPPTTPTITMNDENATKQSVAAQPSVAEEKCITYPTITYNHLRLIDTAEEPISNHFKQTVEWLCARKLDGSRVLVHCNCGVSRSATLIAAYYIATGPPSSLGDPKTSARATTMTLIEALTLLRRLRSIICPNEGFLHQLLQVNNPHMVISVSMDGDD
jgi:predicted protein tyrosine phosphatase